MGEEPVASPSTQSGLAISCAAMMFAALRLKSLIVFCFYDFHSESPFKIIFLKLCFCKIGRSPLFSAAAAGMGLNGIDILGRRHSGNFLNCLEK